MVQPQGCLSEVENEVDDIDTEQVRSQYLESKARIQGDARLTQEGRAEHLGALKAQANAQIAAAEAASQTAAASERSRLEERLMRPPVGFTASSEAKIAASATFRDAMQRASATSPLDNSLRELHDLAQLTGDESMARAAMVVGMRRGDPDVVNAWSRHNPTHEASVDRLFELMHQPPSVQQRFLGATQFAKVH